MMLELVDQTNTESRIRSFVVRPRARQVVQCQAFLLLPRHGPQTHIRVINYSLYRLMCSR